MKRIIRNGVYTIVALSGATQFYLLPGLIWNITFPILQILLLLFAFKSFSKNKYLKCCSFLIGAVVIIDVGFSIYSNSNISSNSLDTELTIMSYNLFFKNTSKEQSISIIKESDPDVLFVQELTPKWASRLEAELGTVYKYRVTRALKGTHGIGIYSKYDIDNQKILNNSAGKPFAQIVDLEINSKSIQLINTHLASPAIAVENKHRFFSLYRENYQNRKNQIKDIMNLTKKGSEKYDCQLLVGDLNTVHSEPLIKRLKFLWVNSNNGLLRWTKFNFPNSSKIFPIVTLDYIFGRGNMKFLESRILNGGTSDHLAILSKIEI